jgi:phosphotransferase system enzyme I (PtsI)
MKVPERQFIGRAAAPGLAEGRLFRLREADRQRVPTGSRLDEADALLDAVQEAARELTALAAATGGDAADMLNFQVAMLEDPNLLEQALELVNHGLPADQAWQATMDAEISGYEQGEDEYFRARASDLADMRARVLAVLNGDRGEHLPGGAVLVADDLPPSRFLTIDWAGGGGVALAGGSPSSHVAMLARARGVPMVVGLGTLPSDLPADATAMVDGGSGTLVIEPTDTTRAALRQRAGAHRERRAATERSAMQPARTADGTPIRVLVNVSDPRELDRIDPAICDGIGLTRSEFLFHGKGPLPDEEVQFAAYARIVRWAAGRPVVLRTLDAGGDKPIAGLTIHGESNPFLGTRGIRLSLARPDIFRVQLRAMVRAAELGDVRIMLPMVAVPAELDAARALLTEIVRELGANATPKLGMMVEVPAAALRAADFTADFYSIGSNDLAQYTLAAARDIAAVAHLNDAANPAVLDLIAHTVAAGAARGVEVSLCGDAAGDPGLTDALLRTCLRTLSMAPAAVAEVKQAIAAVDLRASA